MQLAGQVLGNAGIERLQYVDEEEKKKDQKSRSGLVFPQGPAAVLIGRHLTSLRVEGLNK
jgi:hypothetical protein